MTPSGNIVTRCPCGEEQLNLNADHGPSFAPDGTMILTSSIQLETRGRFNSELLCHFLVQNGRPIFCSDATCPGGRTEAGVRCEEESE